MGLSNTFVFSFTQTFACTVGHGLTMMPSFILLARVIPPGFESTMMAISAAIIQFNIETLRDLIGVLLNYLFVGVSKDNFENFYTLILIQLIGSILPLMYIDNLVPSKEEVKCIELEN